MPVNADNNSPDGKIRVLALEDDRVVRRVLSDILANECVFKAVETYNEFTALLNTFNPDVLLLDRMLPDGTAFPFAANCVATVSMKNSLF